MPSLLLLPALGPRGAGCRAVGALRMPWEREVCTLGFVVLWPSFPWAVPAAGALPAAQWLLCVCSFQLLSISLNGPIQGHSCTSETLAAGTQSAEKGAVGRT